MNDSTEPLRRQLVQQINDHVDERAELEARHGQVWNTEELREDFEVLGFASPFVVIRRMSDGVKGTLAFQHSPRFYFSFQEDK